MIIGSSMSASQKSTTSRCVRDVWSHGGRGGGMPDLEWMRILNVLAEHPEGLKLFEMCILLGWSMNELMHQFYYVRGIHDYVVNVGALSDNVFVLNDYGREARKRVVQERLF